MVLIIFVIKNNSLFGLQHFFLKQCINAIIEIGQYVVRLSF